MKNYLFLIVSILSLAVTPAFAQEPSKIYFIRNDVKIADGTRQLSAPWCGGMNNPQFSLADLNNDGNKDLVIYEQDLGVRTFINTGVNGNPRYEYDGNYEYLFPENMRTFLILKDYNNDGVTDLFHGGGAGVNVYIGYFKDNKLHFKFYKDLYFTSPVAGLVNVGVTGNDMPAILDMDGDSDLDIVAYGAWGNLVSFYRNCSVEDGLPIDSIKICLKDECWGKYKADIIRPVMLQQNCDYLGNTSCKGCGNGSGNKTTHQGNALCVLDYDGDKDFDLLLGHAGFPDLQYLINGRNNVANPPYPRDSMVAQDTIWGSNGKDYVTDIFPAAFHIDINQDGSRDILVSPHQKDAENYKTVWYYKNTGTDNAPNFVYQTDKYLVEDMIDVGSNSHPAFYDYNKDGKPDLFVGSDGYYRSGSTPKVMISYYENTSTVGNPSFKLITNDFLSLSAKNLNGGAINFGDVNADGKDDIIIGQKDGYVLYYLNSATDNTVQPQWPSDGLRVKTQAGVDIQFGDNAVPVLYDIDADGKKDLVVGTVGGVNGNTFGQLSYYKNTGDTNNVSFQLKSDKLGDVNINQAPTTGLIETYPAPFIGPLDNSGKEYLLIGSQAGNLYLFDGFNTGNPAATYTKLTEHYQDLKPGVNTVPAAADVDGDGKYELVVGNYLGGLMLYRQIFEVSVDDVQLSKSLVKVYPNPAKDVLKLTWPASFAASGIDVRIINATGQTVLARNVKAGEPGVELNISSLQSGMYYSIVQAAGQKAVNTIAIIK